MPSINGVENNERVVPPDNSSTFIGWAWKNKLPNVSTLVVATLKSVG